MRQLDGKTALVTGAARGIGRALAEELARAGVRLTLADRDEAGLTDTVEAVRAIGIDAEPHLVDLVKLDQVDRLADEVLARSVGVDLLVNNAGVACFGPTDEAPVESIDRLLAINLAAPMRLTHRLLPAMLARPESHVLNVASVLGLVALPRVAAYTATKFGMVGFSESLRAEYGRVGLGVTTLCPGLVPTPLLSDAQAWRPVTHRRRRPPALLCVSPERVARAAVRGVRRNRRRVTVDPVGGWVRGAMSWAPGLVDWAFALGRRRRVENKRRELARLDPDRTTALRLQLMKQDERAATRRAA